MRTAGFVSAALILGFCAVASAQPDNYSSGVWTWYGAGLAPVGVTDANLINVSNSDAKANSGNAVGNISLATYQALGYTTLINFDVTGVTSNVVNSVVAQYSATQNVTFGNFTNGSATPVNFNDTFDGGRGRTTGSGANYLQANIHDYEFSVTPSDPTQIISTIGFMFCGEGGNNGDGTYGDGSGRDDGPGTITFTLSDSSTVVDSLPELDVPGGPAGQQNVWVGYSAPAGLGVVSVTYHKTGSTESAAGNPGIDDLSFGLASVPEPASLSLLGLGGLALLARRRNK